MSLPFIISKNSITISHNNMPKTILASDPNFEACKKAIQNEDWEQAIRLIDPACVIEDRSNSRFFVQDGQVYLRLLEGKYWEVPSVLNKKILSYMENDWPFESLVNFAFKLSQNPCQDSMRQLFPFLEHNAVTLYPDGDFLLYKKVRNDYLDFYTGTMDNSPGKIVEMSREQVTHDPQITCSQGLHAANWDYADRVYHGGSGIMLALKVNPADVVSVPVDYNNSKIRVCRYYVECKIDTELPENAYIMNDEDLCEELEDDEDEEDCSYEV